MVVAIEAPELLGKRIPTAIGHMQLPMSHLWILASAAAGTRGGGTIPSSTLHRPVQHSVPRWEQNPNKPIKTNLVASGQEASLPRSPRPVFHRHVTLRLKIPRAAAPRLARAHVAVHPTALVPHVRRRTVHHGPGSVQAAEAVVAAQDGLPRPLQCPVRRPLADGAWPHRGHQRHSRPPVCLLHHGRLCAVDPDVDDHGRLARAHWYAILCSCRSSGRSPCFVS